MFYQFLLPIHRFKGDTDKMAYVLGGVDSWDFQIEPERYQTSPFQFTMKYLKGKQ